MQHAVIMAGGAGKRLWPLSRQARPKQLLPLVGGKSLIEISVDRLKGQFDLQNILIVTNREYADQVRDVLNELPPENIIGEPIGRDTANAVALGTEIVAGRDPKGVMAIFTADHVIRPVDIFRQNVQQAVDAAVTNPDALLTFGVRPTWPHTGLGYIHHAKQSIEEGLYEVEGFTEKPDHHTARRFVDSGQYCWNSGMFVWTVPAIRNALTKYLPDSAKKLAPVAEAVREGKDPSGIIDKVYPQLEKISIDYAVMEKAEKVLMVELKCEWLDVGSWPAMENVTDLDEGGNAVLADNAIMIDSFRNIVVSEDEHLLAVLGIDDCVVVHAKDATLVCTKSDAQRLKELVNHLGEKYGGKYV